MEDVRCPASPPLAKANPAASALRPTPPPASTIWPGADTTAAAARAGRGNAPREPAINLLEAAIGLYDRPSIQAALDSVLRLTLSGGITPERARVAIRACSAAARNFDTADILGGRKTADHDSAAYYTKVRAVLSSIDPLLERAAAANTTDEGDLE